LFKNTLDPSFAGPGASETVTLESGRGTGSIAPPVTRQPAERVWERSADPTVHHAELHVSGIDTLLICAARPLTLHTVSFSIPHCPSRCTGILRQTSSPFAGYGAHSADAEYVLLDSIEPRLYLLTRMIMDVSQGKISPAQ